MDLHLRPKSAISISRTSPDYIRTEKQNFIEDHTFNSRLANLVEILKKLNERGSSSLDLNISEF
jgi:hypothetical protein